MARLDPAIRLQRVATLLHANAPPRYVRQPLPVSLRKQMPNEGWYWVPPGKTELVFLARDAYDAYHELMTLLERELETP